MHKVFPGDFVPPCFIMSETESFASLLIADLCTNTDAFLSVYRDGISRSSDPIAALRRFCVETLTANKSDTFSEHKLSSIAVKDQKTNQYYNFFIERNPSKSKVRASTFPPFSLASVSTTSTRAVARDTGNRECSDIPLLLLNTSSDSVLTLLPPTRPSRFKSQYSLREKFSLTSVEIMHSSSTSFDSVAVDRILGRGMFLNDSILREIGKVVCQIQPVGLSLFELGILTNVIHNEEPHYSLLKSQCYWFMNTIFNVVRILYRDNLNETPNMITPDDYLPDSAGRFMDMLIVNPKDDLLCDIARRCSERQYLILPSDHRLLPLVAPFFLVLVQIERQPSTLTFNFSEFHLGLLQ